MRTNYPLLAALILSCSIQATLAQDSPSKDRPEGKPATKDLAPANQLNNWLSALRWRPIGPTAMGGRIVDLAVHPQDPNHFFVANATGRCLLYTYDAADE
mgnify:CR=1 FL=1